MLFALKNDQLTPKYVELAAAYNFSEVSLQQIQPIRLSLNQWSIIIVIVYYTGSLL